MAFGSAGSAGTVEVDVKGDFTQFKQGLDQQGNAAGGQFGNSFGKGFGSKVATLGATYLGANFAKGAISAASDLTEATNVTGLAFGSARGEIDKMASSAADNFGLAEAAYRQLGAQVGNIFVGSGVAEADAAKLTNNLIARASDIGSAWNASTEDVTESINAGLIGSFEPLRKYGVIIDQAAVKQKGLELGLADSNGELDAAAEKLAINALILEQTDNVAGDFKNTQDGVANSAKTLGAMWTDMQAQLGTALLPTIATLLKLLRGLGPDGLKFIVIGGGILLIFVKLASAAKALGGAFSLLAANPWVLVALAIIAVGILIWKNWDTIVEKLGAAWSWIKDTAGALADWFVAAWETVTSTVTMLWQGMVDGILIGVDGLVTGVTVGFTTVIDTVTMLWSGFIAGILAGVDGLVLGVTTGFNAIVTAITTAWSAVTSATSTAWGAVKSTVLTIGGEVVGWITGIPGKITGAFSSLADAISGPFKTAFAAIKSAWNNTVGGFSVSIPGVGPFPGASFTIPSMAAGAVVGSPTLAIVGDAGVGNREIVTPENLMRDTVADALAAQGSGGVGGVTVAAHLHVDGNVDRDWFASQLEGWSVELVRVVERELDRGRLSQGQPRGGL